MAAQRRGWRYFATRLKGDGTEVMLHSDLPLESVSIETTLSGDGAISGEIDPVYTSLLGPDGLPILREWSTAIYAENNGDIRGGGILTSSELEGSNWSLDCVGFTGYGRDMPYVGDGYKGVKVDPIDVVRVIWNHIQNRPGGDIGLEWDDTTTGGKVTIGTELHQVDFDTKSGPVSFEAGPYKLNWYTNHDLQGDVDALAQSTPFDYVERHSWREDGTIRHFVEVGYPSIGKRQEDMRFIYGVNVFEPFQVGRDGVTYASGTLVLGAGDGASMIHSIREATERPDGRLRRIAVVIDDTIKSKKRADARADAENKWRSRLDDVTTVVVRDHPAARLGAVGLGDEIRLEGRNGWAETDMWVRVLGISFSPENGNVAEYTIARTDRLVS